MNPQSILIISVFLGEIKGEIHDYKHLKIISHQQIQPQHNQFLGLISTHNPKNNLIDYDRFNRWIVMKLKTIV